MAVTNAFGGRVMGSIVAARSKVDAGIASTSRVRVVNIGNKTVGTGAGQSNRNYRKDLTLANDASGTIDFSGGETDGLGDVLLMGTCTGIMLRNTNTANTSGYFEVTMPSALGGNVVRVRAGMFLLIGFGDVAGVAVTTIGVTNKVGASATLEVSAIGVAG